MSNETVGGMRIEDGKLLLHEGIHCKLTIERPVPGVSVVRISGHDLGEFGDVALRELEKEITSHQQIELFIDARDAQSASIDVSSVWAHWLAKNRSAFKHVTMLTGSRFVQVTANFVQRFSELGDLMHIYTDPLTFDTSLAVSCQSRVD